MSRALCKTLPAARFYTIALDFSQTSLVYISGYVNTENVLYLLIRTLRRANNESDNDMLTVLRSSKYCRVRSVQHSQVQLSPK